jgi:hypothetical protein
MSNGKPMRQAMPGVAGFIAAMRATFGDDTIVRAMREGAKTGDFWAIEGEHVIGNPWSPWPRGGPCMPPTKCSAELDRLLTLSERRGKA